MSKLTALQQAMRILEKHAHNLFNVYNADSRAFLDEMKNCLELERDQMEDAYLKGSANNMNDEGNFEQYYNETFRGEQ